MVLVDVEVVVFGVYVVILCVVELEIVVVAMVAEVGIAAEMVVDNEDDDTVEYIKRVDVVVIVVTIQGTVVEV